MRDAGHPALQPRHVGSGAHAERDHPATRLRAEALRAAGELQASSEVPLRGTAL